MRKDSTISNGCPTESGPDTSNWGAYLNSECAWIDAWVELVTPSDVERYREYLSNYAREQQRLGRFSWPPNIRLTNLMDWMAYSASHPGHPAFPCWSPPAFCSSYWSTSSDSCLPDSCDEHRKSAFAAP